jgi:hypothetical protein
MRIYPDPDLPDVKVSWYEEVCAEDAGDVVVALVGLDSSSRVEKTAPCVGPDVVFEDVPREQFRVEATLLDTAGNTLVQATWDADLRDGIDEKVELYFNPYSTFRVAWTFDAGESCASLGAEVMAIELLPSTEQLVYADCRDTPYYGYVRNGTYTMRLRAESATATVAVSAESAPFTLSSLDVTDLGTLTLSPCAPCPGP